MTNYYRFTLVSQLIRNANHNRSNGGVAFVFVRIFGRKTRLKSAQCPKILTSAKSHTPEQIAKNITKYSPPNSRYALADCLNLCHFSCHTNLRDRLCLNLAESI